jgi:hypothetical protein
MAKKSNGKPAKSQQRTLVTFVLDATSSMEPIKSSTIEAFNTYLEGLRDDSQPTVPIDFTLIQFSTERFEKTHFEKPVKDVPRLSNGNYRPSGGTPLIDASVKTIRALDVVIGQKADKPKVVVCIQTDGEENSSREHTWEELRALIKERTEQGWQFNFLGAGIDAYDQGQRMGIAATATMSYDPSQRATSNAAFAASASNTRSFLVGESMDTSYSMSQRSSSGDAFAHRAQPTAPVPAALDLTSPGNATGGVTGQAKPVAKRKSAIGDISL